MQLENSTVDLNLYPKRTSKETISPFRYPGGKGFLSGYFTNVFDDFKSGEKHYVEPFCGGAGSAWNLLADDIADTIHLNDADIRIYSAWKAILHENERFCERLNDVAVDIKTWTEARRLLTNYSGKKYDFDLGFATYFVNRTSRAGIILGSGPIGGYEQSGDWKIDARFYRETMLRRIKWIGNQKQRVELNSQEALTFLKENIKKLPSDRTLYFVDPPYLQAGRRLYLNAMTEKKHRALGAFLTSDVLKHWILTYDDHPLIREIYDGRKFSKLVVNYSLSRIRKESEVLVS
ncbi:MAG: DNA adenine methylase [Aestuariivita sp.]|nr:DNA adenine methylase [Aestuariivita sp.]